MESWLPCLMVNDLPILADLWNAGIPISMSLNNITCYCFTSRSTKHLLANLRMLVLYGSEFCTCSPF